MNIKYYIPVDIVSPNVQEHWSKRHNRNIAIDRELKKLSSTTEFTLPCHVILTRHCSREFDYDNLVTAFKGARDRVANILVPGLAPGRADGDRRVSWEYKQKKEKRGGFTIEIVTS